MISPQIQEIINSTGVVKPKEPNKILGKDDFLKLLLTELKHQDFTKVADDKQFIAQLAQFSTLEQTKQMAENLGASIQFQQLSQASSLLQKEIELVGSSPNNPIKGVVEQVKMSKGQVKLVVNGKEYTLNDIKSIK